MFCVAILQGYRMENQFIVGQWPVKSSIHDFWRLALDQQICVTVVLHSMQQNSRVRRYIIYNFYMESTRYNMLTPNQGSTMDVGSGYRD